MPNLWLAGIGAKSTQEVVKQLKNGSPNQIPDEIATMPDDVKILAVHTGVVTSSDNTLHMVPKTVLKRARGEESKRPLEEFFTNSIAEPKFIGSDPLEKTVQDRLDFLIVVVKPKRALDVIDARFHFLLQNQLAGLSDLLVDIMMETPVTAITTICGSSGGPVALVDSQVGDCSTMIRNMTVKPTGENVALLLNCGDDGFQRRLNASVKAIVKLFQPIDLQLNIVGLFFAIPPR